MKGELRIRGSVRVLSFDLDLDVTCQSFDEVEKTLSLVDSLKNRYPPRRSNPDDR